MVPEPRDAQGATAMKPRPELLKAVLVLSEKSVGGVLIVLLLAALLVF